MRSDEPKQAVELHSQGQWTELTYDSFSHWHKSKRFLILEHGYSSVLKNNLAFYNSVSYRGGISDLNPSAVLFQKYKLSQINTLRRVLDACVYTYMFSTEVWFMAVQVVPRRDNNKR